MFGFFGPLNDPFMHGVVFGHPGEKVDRKSLGEIHIPLMKSVDFDFNNSSKFN